MPKLWVYLVCAHGGCCCCSGFPAPSSVPPCCAAEIPTEMVLQSELGFGGFLDPCNFGNSRVILEMLG